MNHNGKPIPFPGDSPGPKLPEMSIPERKLWAASHRLPENMLLVSTSEMQRMQQTLLVSATNAGALRKFIFAAFGVMDTAVAIERYNKMVLEYNALEAFFLAIKKAESLVGSDEPISLEALFDTEKKLKALGWKPSAPAPEEKG